MVSDFCKQVLEIEINRPERENKNGCILQLIEAHKERERDIRKCISETQHNVESLKQLNKSSPDDVLLYQKLRKEQSKVCLMSAAAILRFKMFLS